MIFPQYEITILAKWHKQIIKIQAEPKYEQKITHNIFKTAFQTCTDYKRWGGCEHSLLVCRSFKNYKASTPSIGSYVFWGEIIKQ